METTRDAVSAVLVRLRLALWLPAAMLLTAAPSEAQDPPPTIHINASPACRGCEITITKVVTLGTPEDSVLIKPVAEPFRDRRGRYYAWSATPGRIAVYDTLGKLQRVFGRTGAGPGEFVQNAGEIIDGGGDSIRVYSPPRMQVFAPNGSFARSAPLPGGIRGNVLMLADGSTVFPTSIATPARAGLPVHLLSPDGTIIRSFGSVPGELNPRCAACMSRWLAPSVNPGRIWANPGLEYRMQEWSVEGSLVRDLVVDKANWFPPRVAARLQSGELRPNRTTPSLIGSWQESNGLLWVMGRTPKSGKVVEGPPARGNRAVNRNDVAQEPRLTLIEAIDLDRRTVLATRALDSDAYGILGGGLIYSRREHPSGVVLVDIWRVTLRRP